MSSVEAAKPSTPPARQLVAPGDAFVAEPAGTPLGSWLSLHKSLPCPEASKKRICGLRQLTRSLPN